MTGQLHSTLRAVVLPAPDAHPQDTPTRRLLGELGHDVARAISPQHAMDLVAGDHTDLLVVDVTGHTPNRSMLETLSELPESQLPDQIAIFTDDPVDAGLREFRHQFSTKRVHVFVKPLHMHGLLGVLRNMDMERAN